MLVAYLSLTGNVKRFVEKLSLPSVEIDPTNPFLYINESFIVVAPTYRVLYPVILSWTSVNIKTEGLSGIA
jgi:protein involved in ribonucleotide reduction